MPDWNHYLTGLHRIGDGCYGYVQPDGTWGLSNAGLVVGGETAFVFDALCDIPRTALFLHAAAIAEPRAATSIDMVAISHRHPDHTQGLAAFAKFPGCRIYMTEITWREWQKLNPEKWKKMIASLQGDGKRHMDELIGAPGTKFDFAGIKEVPPTDFIDRNLELDVGGRKVVIEEVGPGHSYSDVMAWVPDAGVAFTGDVFSAGNHLSLNNPPFENMVKMCDKLLAWCPRRIVPGHRAICDIKDVAERKQYFLWLRDAVRARYDRGMEMRAAADDLYANLGEYADYAAPDNLWSTIQILYAEWGGNMSADMRTSWGKFIGDKLLFKEMLREKHKELAIPF